MKKILLGTSAVALAGAFANSAHAVDWEVTVGGYMEQYAAYSSPEVDGLVDDDYDGIDNKGEAEVHFKPSITLDNGLKIGADIQLEGNTDTVDQIDESFLFLDGSFGRVLLGSENSAGYLMTYAAPDVTFLNVNSGSLTKFIPYSGAAIGEVGDFDGDGDDDGVATLQTGDDIFRGTLGATFIENGRNNDAQRFTYFTPRFAGFQVGVSYARDPRQDDQQQLNLDVQETGLSNIFDVGANYVNSFGAFDIAVSGRYGIATNDTTFDDVFPDDDDEFFDEDTFDDNPQVWSAGLNLGFAGFTVGGSFAEQNGTIDDDGTGWDAGVAYETGPWGISFTYFNGENVDDENAFLGADEELKQYLLGVNYDLAKGVALNAFGAYADFDEDIGDTIDTDADGIGDTFGVNPGGDDVDGWVVGTGIKVSF